MTVLDAVILGLIQGLTEFLPVSSSGHLVLFRYFLNLDPSGDISFEVFVHFGTMISILVIFRKDIASLCKEFLNALLYPSKIPNLYVNSNWFRLMIFIIIGCIPAGFVGVMFEDSIEELFSDAKLTSMMLIVTGLILFFTRFVRANSNKKLGVFLSLCIGMAQAVAIIPGISRSGATISAGLYMGLSQEMAARFSFLMALPVIFGAALLKAFQLYHASPSSLQIIVLISATFIAFVSGYIAIKFLLQILKRGKFTYFSYYCFLIGVIGVLFIK